MIFTSDIWVALNWILCLLLSKRAKPFTLVLLPFWVMVFTILENWYVTYCKNISKFLFSLFQLLIK